MNRFNRAVGPHSQKGVTLLGLVFWGVLVGTLALLLAKLVPVVNEYNTIRGIVNRMATEGGSTVPEIRASFDRFRVTQYGIESITGKDLDISKEDDKIVVRFITDGVAQTLLAGLLDLGEVTGNGMAKAFLTMASAFAELEQEAGAFAVGAEGFRIVERFRLAAAIAGGAAP